MNQKFDDIRACVFDAYGTLFDVHSAAAQHSHRLGELETPVSELWRAKQLQYTWLRSLMGAYEDFWTVTENSLDYALASYGISENGLRDDLMNAYLKLSCFDEVMDVLKTLKQHDIQTAILSNGSPAMLEGAVENSGVGEYIDACISVDVVRVYKPTAEVYQLPCTIFGIQPSQVSFQSSNCWDAIGGAHFGYQVAWCNRYGQQLDRLPAKPQVEIQNLTELLPLVGIKN